MASSKQKQIEQEDHQVPNYLDLINLPADDPHYYYSNSSYENMNFERGIDSETRKVVYPCAYCPRKFCNSRALGGHQNAHKRERAITKKLSSTLLSIQAHSLIHKPQYSYPPPIIAGSPLYGHSGWGRTPLDGLQPSVGQLAMDNNYNYMGSSSERGGGGVFDHFDGFNHKFVHSTVDTRFKTANMDDDEEGNLDLSLKL